MTANSETKDCDNASKALASQNYPRSPNLKPLAESQPLPLDSLVAKITLDNRHPELTFGVVAGVELF